MDTGRGPAPAMKFPAELPGLTAATAAAAALPLRSLTFYGDILSLNLHIISVT